MSQRDKDRVITNIIENLIKPEPVPPSPLLDQRSTTQAKWFYGVVIVAGALALFLITTAASHIGKEDDIGQFARVVLGIGVVSLIVVIALIFRIVTHEQVIANEQLNATEYARQIHLLRAHQITELVDKVSAVEVQRYATEGAFNSQDLLNAQQREQRDWQSSESDKDRSLTRDTLEMQIEGDIRKIEKQIEAEFPSASKQNQHDRERLDGHIGQLKVIKGITNKTVRKQAYDTFTRGKN